MKSIAASTSDRRRFPRQMPKEGIQIRCQLKSRTNQKLNIALTVVDISQTGVRMIVSNSLDIGDEIKVHLFPPDDTVQVQATAEVVWESKISETTSLVGLRWKKLLQEEDVLKLTHSVEWTESVDHECDELTVTQLFPRKKLGSDHSQQTAYLVHIYPKGPDMGRRYRLSQAPTILGRESRCDVVLNSESVSRRHACVQPIGREYELLDLQSTNGTLVNDQPIEQHRLHDGDYVQVGNCIFRYLAGGNVEAEYHEEIYRLTIMDTLTNIANKRCLLEFLERELSRSHRYNRPLSLIMLDVDHFKSVNDNLGHLGGDAALRELAAMIKNEVRTEELFARYGGEEFVVVLPETTREGGLNVANRIRQLIADHAFHFDGEDYQLTVSSGLSFTQGETGLKPLTFIARADKKLYEAKQNGRNCVVG